MIGRESSASSSASSHTHADVDDNRLTISVSLDNVINHALNNSIPVPLRSYAGGSLIPDCGLCCCY